jgi:methionine-rich copper-binding protein CopC
MTYLKIATVTAAALALFTAADAQAHAKLLSSSPTDGATVAAPRQIVLSFSEKLQPKFSTARLVMPTMSNMPMPAKATVAKDGKTLVVTPTKPLMAGDYAVQWTAVTADTHRIEGKVSFVVR